MGNESSSDKPSSSGGGKKLGSDPELAAKQKALADAREREQQRQRAQGSSKPAASSTFGGSSWSLTREKPNYGGGRLGGVPGAGPPKPERVRSNESRGGASYHGMSKAGEAEAKRKAALEKKQQIEAYARQEVQAGLTKLSKCAPDARLRALEMLEKLLGNIVTHPAEPKYQKIRLTNAKIAAVVVETDGAREVLQGAGFHIEGEFMVFSDENDKSRNALNSTVTTLRSALFELKGTPLAGDELGGQAQFGRWDSAGKIGQDDALAAEVASRGGVCAEKFDAATDDGDSFTIEHARELESALDHVRDNNNAATNKAALEMIFGILDRINADPENAASRCIPNNAELHQKVAGAEGSLHLLEVCGFKLMEVDRALEYVNALGTKTIRSVAERIEVARKSAGLRSSIEEISASSRVPETVDRELKVLRVIGEANAANITIPEHYFTLTAADVKGMGSSTSAQGTMTTEHMRQKAEALRRRKYKRALLRVQFPDGMLLQMAFSPRERVQHVMEAVQGCIQDPAREFTLSLASTSLDQPSRSLWDAQLVPSALLHFRWTSPSSSDDIGAILLDELLCQVEFIE